jgi:hypothetical protein
VDTSKVVLAIFAILCLFSVPVAYHAGMKAGIKSVVIKLPEETIPVIEMAKNVQKAQEQRKDDLKGITMKVIAMDRWEGDRFSEPKAGHMFVALDLSISNGGKGQIHLNSLCFSVRQDDGTEFGGESFGAEPRLPLRDLGPGQLSRGWLTFEVPLAINSGQLVFRPIGGEGELTAPLP